MLDPLEAAHRAALVMPYPNERPMTNLINAIDGLVALNGTENPGVNEAMARLIIGADILIFERTWGRIERAIVHDHLDALALRVGLDLQTRKFTKKATPNP